MITDDHKSTGVNAPKQMQASYDVDWDPRASMFSTASAESTADYASSSRRSSLRESVAPQRKRSKPYESARSSIVTRSRRSDTTEGNVYPTVISATTTGNPYPDTSSISPFTSAPPSIYSSTAPPSPQLFDCDNSSGSLPSPPNSNRFLSPINTSQQTSTFFENTDAIMEEAAAAVMNSNFFPTFTTDNRAVLTTHARSHSSCPSIAGRRPLAVLILTHAASTRRHLAIVSPTSKSSPPYPLVWANIWRD